MARALCFVATATGSDRTQFVATRTARVWTINAPGISVTVPAGGATPPQISSLPHTSSKKRFEQIGSVRRRESANSRLADAPLRIRDEDNCRKCASPPRVRWNWYPSSDSCYYQRSLMFGRMRLSAVSAWLDGLGQTGGRSEHEVETVSRADVATIVSENGNAGRQRPVPE